MFRPKKENKEENKSSGSEALEHRKSCDMRIYGTFPMAFSSAFISCEARTFFGNLRYPEKCKAEMERHNAWMQCINSAPASSSPAPKK